MTEHVLPPIAGGEMGFATPLRVATVTNQTDTVIPASGTQSKFYGGCVITSGAAATTVIIRNGTSATDPIMFTYKVEVANATRQFLLAPALVYFSTGVYADVDANTAEVDVLIG